MKIIFNNNIVYDYIEAYTLDKDFKNGYTRPSLEVRLAIDYNTIINILNDPIAVKKITLIGEEETDIFGNPTGIQPMSEYIDYTILGKVIIEDGITSFKLYRLSDVEIKMQEAEAAIDELLIAMEV